MDVLAKRDGANLLAAHISDPNPRWTLIMPEPVIDTVFDRASSSKADYR